MAFAVVLGTGDGWYRTKCASIGTVLGLAWHLQRLTSSNRALTASNCGLHCSSTYHRHPLMESPHRVDAYRISTLLTKKPPARLGCKQAGTRLRYLKILRSSLIWRGGTGIFVVPSQLQPVHLHQLACLRSHRIHPSIHQLVRTCTAPQFLLQIHTHIHIN